MPDAEVNAVCGLSVNLLDILQMNTSIKNGGFRIQDILSKKKKRHVFTDFQLCALHAAFERSPYIEPDLRKRMSIITGLTEQQIKIWFQNRRYKIKMNSMNDVE